MNTIEEIRKVLLTNIKIPAEPSAKTKRCDKLIDIKPEKNEPFCYSAFKFFSNIFA